MVFRQKASLHHPACSHAAARHPNYTAWTHNEMPVGKLQSRRVPGCMTRNRRVDGYDRIKSYGFSITSSTRTRLAPVLLDVIAMNLLSGDHATGPRYTSASFV